MYLISKQILAIGLPVVVVAASGVAVAFWSGGGGTGTGTATTATPSASTLVVTQASAPANMAPGVAAGSITATVTNPADAPANVYASQVVVSISSVTQATGATGTCTADDYTLTLPTMTTGAKDLAPNTSTTFSGASLQFKNSASVNQDGCKGATVNLSYTAS